MKKRAIGNIQFDRHKKWNEDQWKARTRRVAKAVELNAPPILIVHGMLICMEQFGWFKVMRFWLRCRYWEHLRFSVQFWWLRRVRGQDAKQIEEKLIASI